MGWEDPLEKGIATHYSILAWRISGTEDPGGLQSMGSQRAGHNWVTNTFHHMKYVKSPSSMRLEARFAYYDSRAITKVLEFQLQHQSFQLTPRTDLL